MKIRNGFVSNSSSSSFIVAFENLPANKKELSKMMFPNNEEFVEKYDHSMSTEDIVDVVWNDIKNQTSLSDEEIIDIAENGYHDFSPESSNYDLKENTKAARKLVKKIKPDFDGKIRLVFRFSDNDGEVVLEHGNIFKNLKHVQISHH